ncbi:MAG: HDOD domain-containing protein [Pseudomonadota bacterium]
MQTLEPVTPDALMDQLSIARQPIVDAQRTVVAYELFNRSQSATSHSVSSDVSFALHAMAQSGAPFAISNCDLFINTVHQALGGAHWDFMDPAKTVIEVPLIPGHVPEQIAESAILLDGLRTRGFRLSFRHSVVAPVYKPWHDLADFVKVELSPATEPNLPALIAAIQARTGAVVVAEKIERADQFEAFKALGVQRFQGFWFSVPELVQPRVLTPGETTALELFNLVRKEAPLDAVELVLKKDAALGLSLLRIINSAAMGLKQPVTSLRQVVQLMGYQKLARWAAMLMTSASQSSTSLLGASAVVRGRMMELLALNNMSGDEAGSAFLVGLLSQLDRMLGTPMATLLERLALDPEVSAALLQRSGKFGDMLSLVVACESDDEQAFAAAFARLGYSNRQINMAHLEALAWGDNIG